MKLDKDTGLPEIPEGYFWRVESKFNGTKICLMKRRRFAKAREVGSRYVFLRYAKAPEDALRDGALLVLKEREDFVFMGDYVGDYPPKKLGVR